MMVIADQAALAIENAQLRASSAQAAAMAERSRLARELHDSVSQALFGISLGTRTSLELLASDPTKARDPMDYVLALADASMAEMRALIFELRPESLQTEGLHAAFHKQAAALVARHKINVQTHLSGSEADLPIHVKEAIYRIGLEAIQNTIKHAHASDVVLTVERPSDNSVVLQIEDNGGGFDARGDFPGHFGLKTMRERAESLAGQFHVTSELGKGTCIRVRIPEAAFKVPKN
jgi:signal transduction histidine kinase